MEEDSGLKKQQDKKEEKKDTSSSVKWNFLTDMDGVLIKENKPCLLYTSPSPRD